MENKYYQLLINNLIEFMWKNYKTSINISEQYKNNENILGSFINYPIEGRKKIQKISININNIKKEIPEDNIFFLKLFVILHEIGHFLLDKSKYIQKEEYADILAYLIAKQLLLKNDFLIFLSFSKNYTLQNIFQIDKNLKLELKDISKLFIYEYTKYFKSKGAL